MRKSVRIGTRSSPLAMVQANMVADALRQAHEGLETIIVPIKSAADWKKQDGERALSAQAGGKGQFAKEIEDIHLKGEIDFGVHSAKDMPSFLPDGLQIRHFMPREAAHDVLISREYKTINDIPAGAIIGTCSPRRQALILSKRKDIKTVPFRGNVRTRLDKVLDGQVDATFLAGAGLKRLGIHDFDGLSFVPLLTTDFLPACGQGAVCMETGTQDVEIHDLLSTITCNTTALCVRAEREVLKILDGSCHTPISAYAELTGDMLTLNAMVSDLNGDNLFYETAVGVCTSGEQAAQIGQEAGNKLRDTVPPAILEY